MNKRGLTEAEQLTRPPTECGRRLTIPCIMRPNRPHGQCGILMGIKTNGLRGGTTDRPPSAPLVSSAILLRSDSTGNAATSDTPKKTQRKRPCPTDRRSARLDQPHEPVDLPARKCGQILRTLLFVESDSAPHIKPNAMLSGCRTTAVGNNVLVGRQSA